jgi:hypothetical protein
MASFAEKNVLDTEEILKTAFDDTKQSLKI